MQEERFYNYLQHEKRYSTNTLAAYRSDLDQFSTWLKTTYELEDLAAVQLLHIRSWLATLVEEEKSASSINRKASTLKSFYNFLEKRGVIPANPTEGISAPKIPFRLPKVHDSDHLDILLSQHHFGTNFAGLRSRLIIELLYETGMRLSELINLEISKIDLVEGSLRVRGKGNKERMLMISADLKKTIETYETEKLEKFGASDTSIDLKYLLLTDKGKKTYPKLIHRTLDKYLPLVTTSQHRNPHSIRHTFATTLLNNGADLNAIKELLGHSSLAATQIYTHNSIEKLKDTYKKAHPKAQQIRKSEKNIQENKE